MKAEYVSYSSIQLAGEDAFIRWVCFGENDTAWNTWLRQYPELQKRLDDARKIVLDLNKFSSDTLPPADKKKVWEQIKKNAGGATIAKPKQRARTLVPWELAVAAALALLIWISTRSSPTTLLADAGEHPTYVLPDNSTVQLNAGSSIMFQEKKYEAERNIRLEGEAFFEVKPGQLFTVSTSQGTITVLGTSFNVIDRPGRFEVACYTGKVRVEADGQSLMLTIGHSCTFNVESHALDRDTFTLSSGQPEWIKGIFVFDDRPLHAVLAELERQFDVRVNMNKELRDIRYTGFFESGDLEQALHGITWPLHLHYSIQNQLITISR